MLRLTWRSIFNRKNLPAFLALVCMDNRLYKQTYVDRDVRLIKNIGDMNAFIRFTQLFAGRIGQPLNYVNLGNDAGNSPNTARSWLSILESSYILYRLQPYYRTFDKRLVKSAKL